MNHCLKGLDKRELAHISCLFFTCPKGQPGSSPLRGGPPPTRPRSPSSYAGKLAPRRFKFEAPASKNDHKDMPTRFDLSTSSRQANSKNSSPVKGRSPGAPERSRRACCVGGVFQDKPLSIQHYPTLPKCRSLADEKTASSAELAVEKR